MPSVGEHGFICSTVRLNSQAVAPELGVNKTNFHFPGQCVCMVYFCSKMFLIKEQVR